jgi:hypothetical protein
MRQFNVPVEAKLIRLLDLLVNPSVTELNCTVFDSSFFRSRKFNNFLLVHALKNCPKISKIEFRNKQFRSSDLVKKKIDKLPIKCFKNSWNNLTSIKCQKDFIVNDNTLKLILENFPNIESVCSKDSYKFDANYFVINICREMRIAVNALSPVGVDHLRNMRRLHSLDFIETPYKLTYRRRSRGLIVSVAGEVPSLQNFAFDCGYIGNQFIEEFAQKYPQKQLLVNKLMYVECSVNFIVKYLQTIFMLLILSFI